MKTNYPKIDIYVGAAGSWKYAASTTWVKTCREAKGRYFAANHGIHIDNIKAKFAKR